MCVQQQQWQASVAAAAASISGGSSGKHQWPEQRESGSDRRVMQHCTTATRRHYCTDTGVAGVSMGRVGVWW
jgi:hypothetical protein